MRDSRSRSRDRPLPFADRGGVRGLAGPASHPQDAEAVLDEVDRILSLRMAEEIETALVEWITRSRRARSRRRVEEIDLAAALSRLGV